MQLPDSIIVQALIVNAVLVFIYMTVWFLIAKARKRIDTVDIAWGLGFVVVAWSAALQRPAGRTLLIAILVSIWGLRLTSHIYNRAKGKDEDPRYKELSDKWQGNFWARAYVSIFMLQGFMILLVSLPVVMATNQQLTGWAWLSIAGALIWLIGFIFEALGDKQLKDFLAQEDHPKNIRSGLWRYTRHPNYFGELTQWWGIGIIALQASFGWIGLVGPLVLTILIVFVSGIPPIEKKRSKDPDYRKYMQETSKLIPLPPRKAET